VPRLVFDAICALLLREVGMVPEEES
jgi:hypothetical protein